MTGPDQEHPPTMRILQLEPDVSAHLAPGDAVITYRRLASLFRTPPLSTARALLRLGKVDRLSKLGTAGLLNAATTAGAPEDADPELRKFEAVFARDALRVNEFIGEFFPRLRWSTVHTLAQVQGVEHDAAREEEPGKIVHEWRDSADPLAQQISAQNGWGWPYYGAVDTTPLFICAIIWIFDANPAAIMADVKRRNGQHWILGDSLTAAVGWLCRRLDDDPDGLLTYRKLNPCGIENQTWRDSWDSLSHADGRLANHDRPVAALDVQVLAFDALAATARHLRARGETREAEALKERANRIRGCLLDQFWVEDSKGEFFAAALDFSETGARRPLRIRISDMGHLLTSELLQSADKDFSEHRYAIIRQLFSPGLLCSAGIRSLHTDEIRYWPGGYHTGSSWLWQSMHIADGLEQHGFTLLAQELRHRCHAVYLRTGLLPEFARGDDRRRVLNDRIVDLWQAADQRKNRLEQPPQEIQAWTVASLYAAKRRIRSRAVSVPAVTTFEQEIIAQLPDRSVSHFLGYGKAPTN